MSLATKPTSQITEVDLEALITDKEAEGKTIDYKRDRLGQSDGDKKEFLYDVSSFANAAGGHIVFGMDENEGICPCLQGRRTE
jgi:predicted HTH transcriptional regulator